MSLSRNELLEARILQASLDAVAFSTAFSALTHMDVESGPSSEDRVRGLEDLIRLANSNLELLVGFAKARPE